MDLSMSSTWNSFRCPIPVWIWKLTMKSPTLVSSVSQLLTIGTQEGVFIISFRYINSSYFQMKWAGLVQLSSPCFVQARLNFQLMGFPTLLLYGFLQPMTQSLSHWVGRVLPSTWILTQSKIGRCYHSPFSVWVDQHLHYIHNSLNSCHKFCSIWAPSLAE